MSASPFFQSAGRGDLLFWGKTQGPTVLTWESLYNTRTNGIDMGEPIRATEGKFAGRDKHQARLGRVVQVTKSEGGHPLI